MKLASGARSPQTSPRKRTKRRVLASEQVVGLSSPAVLFSLRPVPSHSELLHCLVQSERVSPLVLASRCADVPVPRVLLEDLAHISVSPDAPDLLTAPHHIEVRG